MNIEPELDCYPLSPMQQGMLFHNLSAPGTGVDIEQIFCTMPEEVDAPVFERAWQKVVERHDILRTTFLWEGRNGLRQKVRAQNIIEFKFEDWRGKSPAEHEKLFEDALETERKRGFNLSEKPPLRVGLFRLGDSVNRFLWTFHHLLLDGRAVVMVLNEVFALYEALIRGEDLQLPPPPPYRTYIDWLRQQDWSAAETFWRQTLKGLTAPTALDMAHTSSRGPRSSRGQQEISLSESVTAALKSLARKNGFTPNTLLQGAWALLLSRYSREEDVVFGAVRACRRSNVPDAGALVGLLINTVPVRIRVMPEAALIPWLKSVREAWNALRDFEHTPLTDIQNWSEVPRGQSLFQTIFNYQDPSWDAALRAQGGPWTKREFGIRSESNYPLAVDAYGGPALVIKILHHRDHFSDDAVTRMLGHFKTLLESMVACPEERVGLLPMLTEAERTQLLRAWNGPAMTFPQDQCVHQLFEKQVAQTPDALAVADKKNRLTYVELNGYAEILAEELRDLGVGPEVCVGVCVERSVEMVAAKLAVWKAGGAYVPMDPSYPVERLKFMLEDAKIPVLLAQESLHDRLQLEIPNLKWLWVGKSPGAFQNPPRRLRTRAETEPVADHESSSHLAYVIYTSGSTGNPKGVEIEHRSLVNLITWHQNTYRVTPADRAAQVATPAFDASVWELWPYLTAGASIHIPDEETRLSSKMLLPWLAAEKITLAFVPTPVAETMLDENWPADCVLRALLTGGDKLHRAPGEHLPCTLLNHYGPTENTVVTTWTAVPPAAETEPPPIGRPLPNTQVYILDSCLQPMPVGVPGELHIGGRGLARGYRHRPELTADKFIPNPFSAEPNALLYRTGDLVRWRPDGQIEFLGRLDHQVKIRGQRIEPGEIEATLLRHPAVREAVVIPRVNVRNENWLAAYVVSEGGVDLPPEELRRFLKQTLPEAMIPPAFAQLAALPLTPNGKVDRHALPAPSVETGARNPVTPPRTPTEIKVAEIWREVLGAGNIDAHDNFFELGGHSLSATQVASRIRDAFQIELPLQDLFDLPTVEELAGEIDAVRKRQFETPSAMLETAVASD